MSQHFMLAMLKKMAFMQNEAGWSLVVCIEDAAHLDAASWLLAMQAARVPGLLLVMACKPFHTFSK